MPATDVLACPSCEADVAFAAPPVLAEITECAECRTELEVVATDPVLLALAPEVEEDWGE
ncbi:MULTISPECIES: lysine biosynthesis protein LysW [Kitasatospora]|uniref:Lysine biosynthesis protein LysW n=1 Tax=Kitasatospora arboriphila TaxID=258052 RepID=A0ABN1TGF2_9ACTN